MSKRTCAAGRRFSLVLLVALALSCLAAVAAAGDGVTSSVDLKFWGRAVFNMHYDTAIQSQDFMAYLVDDQEEEFNFNPRDTRLGFKAASSQGDWTYGAVFEMDFYGDNAGNNLLPRLRLGFVEAKRAGGLSIRGGQDWVPVAAQNPGTIDFGIQAWSGNLWWRVPQLTLRYRPAKIEYMVGVMKHRISNDQEAQEKMPWVLGRIGVSDLLGEGSLVALGGGVRSVSDLSLTRVVEDVTWTSTADYSPYLVALEMKLPFAQGWCLTGEAYAGQGVGREFIHYGLDYNPWHPGGQREIASKGGFVSLRIPATPKMHFNAGYGVDDPDDEDLDAMAAPYLKNESLFANLKYAVTEQFGWGLELVDFTTTGTDGELNGQRVTGSWWFVF